MAEPLGSVEGSRGDDWRGRERIPDIVGYVDPSNEGNGMKTWGEVDGTQGDGEMDDAFGVMAIMVRKQRRRAVIG